VHVPEPLSLGLCERELDRLRLRGEPLLVAAAAPGAAAAAGASLSLHATAPRSSVPQPDAEVPPEVDAGAHAGASEAPPRAAVTSGLCPLCAARSSRMCSRTDCTWARFNSALSLSTRSTDAARFTPIACRRSSGGTIPTP
tara:strand:- start:437 stop:859 length:423 start_codon:yes stop_codon:yes gene_type:complete